MSLAAVLRANNPSQPNIVTEIKYSSQNSTACDHVTLTSSELNPSSSCTSSFGTVHGRVVTRRELLDNAWGPGRAQVRNYLEVHIRRIRVKIESDVGRPTRIRTVRGMGYIFDLQPSTFDILTADFGLTSAVSPGMFSFGEAESSGWAGVCPSASSTRPNVAQDAVIDT